METAVSQYRLVDKEFFRLSGLQIQDIPMVWLTTNWQEVNERAGLLNCVGRVHWNELQVSGGGSRRSAPPSIGPTANPNNYAGFCGKLCSTLQVLSLKRGLSRKNNLKLFLLGLDIFSFFLKHFLD